MLCLSRGRVVEGLRGAKAGVLLFSVVNAGSLFLETKPKRFLVGLC
jgi:hypothetical protein